MAKRSAPVDAEKPAADSTNSAIFGGAKPVDTSAKEREIEEKIQKQTKTPRSRTASERSNDESADHHNNKPSPFGGAKPVNTSKREREIEEKLRNVDIDSSGTGPGADNKNRRNNNQSRNNKGEAAEKKVRSPPPPKKVEEDKPPVSH